jgi:hypothetical protein
MNSSGLGSSSSSSTWAGFSSLKPTISSSIARLEFGNPIVVDGTVDGIFCRGTAGSRLTANRNTERSYMWIQIFNPNSQMSVLMHRDNSTNISVKVIQLRAMEPKPLFTTKCYRVSYNRTSTFRVLAPAKIFCQRTHPLSSPLAHLCHCLKHRPVDGTVGRRTLRPGRTVRFQLRFQPCTTHTARRHSLSSSPRHNCGRHLLRQPRCSVDLP